MKNLKLMSENLMIGKCGSTLAMLAVLSIIGWTLSAGAPGQKAAANLPVELESPCAPEAAAAAVVAESVTGVAESAPSQVTRRIAPRRNVTIFIFDGVRATQPSNHRTPLSSRDKKRERLLDFDSRSHLKQPPALFTRGTFMWQP
ncbi:MAG: hypothetical protein QOG71_3724 [Pyrinomonadaceae bacterium]|nr:hypothetical protein [Pyrinomonadaceae bacterium]